MTIKKLLDYDPVTGVRETFEYDPMNDLTIIHTEQDVEPYLELNKARQNELQDRRELLSDMSHYACIPNVIIQKWLVEEGINVFDKNHQKKVFQKLNSPEYRYLKSTTFTHNIK